MECEGVRSLWAMSPQDGSPVPAFLPGQHVVVRVYPVKDGVPLVRIYSLCGPPGASSLRIAIKREANGAGSIYMHEQVHDGDILEISAPRGTFTLSEHKGPLVLLSAGVGITPLLSILYQVARQDPGRELWWIYSCRNGAYDAFWQEVGSAWQPAIQFAPRVIIYSSPIDTEISGSDYDIKGHLDLQKLQAMQLPMESECYLCGPPAYTHAITDALNTIGIAAGNIKTELFDNDTAIRKPAPGKSLTCQRKTPGRARWLPSAKAKYPFGGIPVSVVCWKRQKPVTYRSNGLAVWVFVITVKQV